MTRRSLALFLALPAFAADVVMHHNTPGRTGAVLDETILSPASLKTQDFGRLFSLVVDGQIYAQPLILSNFEIPGKGPRNVVFLATMRNMVYAYDADGLDAAPFWKKSLGGAMPFDRIPKDPGAKLGQYNIRPYIGITSTPVIDRVKGRLYVVAKIAEPACPGFEDSTPACPVVYRIFALDLRNGDILRQSAIEIPMHNPAVAAADVARRHLQRSALLLANGRIYAAFGAHQDAPPFQGWLMSFDPDTLASADPVFCTTPGGEMGGIWQAGNGPAADDAGNLYFMTGNGTFDPNAKQYANSLLKLSPSLSPIATFTPANVKALTLLDIDLGSAGPLLLPDTNQIVGGGKQGRLYLLNRDDPGGQQPHHWWREGNNPPIQYFQASRPWRISWLSWFPLLFNVGYHHLHGSPVYWDGPKGPMIYVWPEEDNVRAYRYDPAARKFDTHPIKGMMGNRGMPGGFLSISANGRQDGILWAAIPAQDDAWVEIVRGAMRAFRADTLEPLWSSDVNDASDNFDFAKNVPPTIANGKVYLATFSDRVNVYGLHSPLAAASREPAPKVSRDPRHRGHIKGATGHGGH
jgi:outer membrane protein assembly factor BamB